MRKSDGFYLNGNNSTVQVTLAHDTSEVQVFNSPLFGDIRVITDENGNPLSAHLMYVINSVTQMEEKRYKIMSI